MLNDMESIIPNFVFFIITMKNIGRKKAIHHNIVTTAHKLRGQKIISLICALKAFVDYK